MIKIRSLRYIAVLAICFLSASLFNVTTKSRNYSESFPALVCPPSLEGLSSQLSVANSQVKYQGLTNRSTKMTSFRTTRFALTNGAIVVNAEGITPVVWESRPGNWSGGALCAGPQISQWFVGGSANVTSRGHLIVANSGLSDAIVDIQVYSEKGKQPLKSITVKSRSFNLISLDSLAPGDQALVVKVAPRSGRINSFMVDEKGAGLRSLGGDLVNPYAAPSKDVTIPAIPNQIQKNGKNSSAHTLRILNPGSFDSDFTAEVLTSNGRFIPVELNTQSIPAGKVSEFKFSPEISAKVLAVHIKSQTPIVAAISTSVTVGGHSDFLWSTGAPKLDAISLAIAGLTPVVVFAGDSISVQLTVTMNNGKKYSRHIKGTDIVTWKAPANSRILTIDSTGKNTYAGAIISSVNGYGYIPLQAGSDLARVEEPSSNIRVLIP